MAKAMLVRAAALAAAMFGALPAEAQHWRDGEWRQIRIDVSALDLSTPAGVDELDRRIKRAVNRICGSDRWCRDEAWASTDEQVAWAIERDEWMRRMAEERIAQLDYCRHRRCGPPRPAYYPVPAPLPRGTVTVTIINAGEPPVVYQVP